MTNPTEVSEEERKKALAALQEIQNNVTAYGAFSVAVQQHLRKQFEIVRAALLRSPQQDKGERIEGWVPNWNLPNGGAMLRGVMKPVPLPDRGLEFYAGPKPVTQDSWTPAVIYILHPTPVSTGEDDGR